MRAERGRSDQPGGGGDPNPNPNYTPNPNPNPNPTPTPNQVVEETVAGTGRSYEWSGNPCAYRVNFVETSAATAKARADATLTLT